jgi:hypothetical protein
MDDIRKGYPCWPKLLIGSILLLRALSPTVGEDLAGHTNRALQIRAEAGLYRSMKLTFASYGEAGVG